MEHKICKKGEVIVRQGQPGDSMYNILWGRVAVYSDYGTEREQKLAELGANDFFGEMELLDKTACNATVVALDAKTELEVITDDDFQEFFGKNPAKAYYILQRLCQKLHKTNQDYLRVCHVIHRWMDAQQSGVTDEALHRDMVRIHDQYTA